MSTYTHHARTNYAGLTCHRLFKHLYGTKPTVPTGNKELHIGLHVDSEGLSFRALRPHPPAADYERISSKPSCVFFYLHLDFITDTSASSISERVTPGSYSLVLPSLLYGEEVDDSTGPPIKMYFHADPLQRCNQHMRSTQPRVKGSVGLGENTGKECVFSHTHSGFICWGVNLRDFCCQPTITDANVIAFVFSFLFCFGLITAELHSFVASFEFCPFLANHTFKCVYMHTGVLAMIMSYSDLCNLDKAEFCFSISALWCEPRSDEYKCVGRPRALSFKGVCVLGRSANVDYLSESTFHQVLGSLKQP